MTLTPDTTTPRADGQDRLARAHAEPGPAVAAALAADLAEGLTPGEARSRLAIYGPNALRRIRRRGAGAILLDQMRSVLVALLFAAAMLSFVLRDWTEGAAILLVLVLNATLGFATELRASRSMDALRELSSAPAVVRRGGRTLVVSAQDLVPGDLVLLEGGDVVSADLRIVEAANLQCDESALTGESLPVRKTAEPVTADAPLADRASMAFKGASVTDGAGAGVVVATGMATELGRVSAMVEAAEAERSPLEKRLERLGRQLVWATFAVAALIFAIGVAQGRDAIAMFQTAIALAVAAVPEGLPVVATVALARGMWRMARRNVLIRRLSAVETLGATTLILTDKTGTLTENRMAAARLVLADAVVERDDFSPDRARPGSPFAHALRVAALCNNASLGDGDAAAPVGDPTEVALLEAARLAGFTRGLADRHPRVRQEAFSSETRRMATLHRDGGGWLVAAKGAPEALLPRVTRVLRDHGREPLDAAGRAAWLERADALAASGLRVLALAERSAPQEPVELADDLTLIGLVGLLDPPRADVKAAIAACHDAGVRVVMLTGDHAATAAAVAEAIGLAPPGVKVIDAGRLADLSALSPAARNQLLGSVVFARIDPGAKLEVVGLHQGRGEVVAMTGDGVNDAPALKKADIGVAMGKRGTQVAREAADMVLRDDAFASIVEAMREGRVIYGNIRKFVIYLLSCNISEILVVGVAAAAALPQPLLPLQILFLNLVTDVFPAFALGFGEGETDVLRRSPRDPRAALLDRRRWMAILGHGASITVATLAAFLLAQMWLSGPGSAVTTAFLTLALAQLWHVFNMRDIGSHVLRNAVTRNPFVWMALAICLPLIAAAVEFAPLADVLGLAPPGRGGWMLAFVASLAPLAVGQLAKAVAARRLHPGRSRARPAPAPE